MVVARPRSLLLCGGGPAQARSGDGGAASPCAPPVEAGASCWGPIEWLIDVFFAIFLLFAPPPRLCSTAGSRMSCLDQCLLAAPLQQVRTPQGNLIQPLRRPPAAAILAVPSSHFVSEDTGQRRLPPVVGQIDEEHHIFLLLWLLQVVLRRRLSLEHN